MSSSPLLLRCLFVALGAGTALLLGEIAIRLLPAPGTASELHGLHRFRPDRPWIYELRPGAEGRVSDTGDALYQINEDGLRDARHARPKPDGVFRIVLMGDSIAFGYGVEQEEAFPQVLERELSRLAPGARIEVVNLGVGGYNAYNEAELLEGVGRSYEPDLVLVQFCINDLNDPTLHFDAQARIALAAVPDAAFPDPSRRRGAHAPSLWARWCAISRLCETGHGLWLALSAPEFDESDRREAVEFIEDGDRPEWQWLEARYLEMARVAREEGAGFAILAFPYQAQLKGSSDHPVQQRLAALGREHGWPVVDPLPAFRQARAARTKLFLDWWHPTPEGHRLAADETSRALACGGRLGAAAQRACDPIALQPAGSD